MIFAIEKILIAIQIMRNKTLFSKVRCDVKKITIGPDQLFNFYIKNPENLIIGDFTCINGDCYIHALGGVSIGSYCHIGKGLTIFSHNHNWSSRDFIPYDDNDIIMPVKIGDAVWIGANVSIAPGTMIGNGVIISTSSTVFGKIPDCAIIRGNPAEIIGYRDKEQFNKLYLSGKFK